MWSHSFFFLYLMAQIVQPLKLPLTEVDLVQSCLSLFLHHP